MIKKIVTSVAISFVCAGALYADTVSLSKNGTGDFLIAPVYVAKGDLCTNVTVMNTNTTSSVLAKVVFRERVASQEVDFPIFLSPGDVWDGTVCGTANGVVLKSDDDSNHPAILDQLKDSGKNLTEQSKNAGHTNVDFTTGYIEIYPIAQYNENSSEKVEKEVLVERWDALAKGNTSHPKLKKDGVDSGALSGVISFATLDTETASIPMTAFVGAHDKQVAGSAVAYSNDTSPELLLGIEKKNQILKLLQHDVVSFVYNNSGENQFINLTFPFGYVADQARTYKITVRDMSENKDVETKEVVIFSPAPKKVVKTNSTHGEVVKLSVADMIAKTSNPEAFTKGMIQITEVKNLDNVQLGKGVNASFIPLKMIEGSLSTTQVGAIHNAANISSTITDIIYVPTK